MYENNFYMINIQNAANVKIQNNNFENMSLNQGLLSINSSNIEFNNNTIKNINFSFSPYIYLRNSVVKILKLETNNINH